jgi:hypothetical protein
MAGSSGWRSVTGAVLESGGLGPGDCDAEGGRGLRLVPELAVRRGLGCPARHIGGVWSVTCIKDYDGGM